MASKQPVTEVASLVLKSGVDVGDKSNQASQAWQETLSTVSSQSGYQRARYGTTLEDPTLMELLIDWDSLAAHQAFIDSPQYAPFVDRLMSILAAPPRLHHLMPSTHPPVVFTTAPVMEMATFYGAEPEFIEHVESFMTNCESQMEGMSGYVFGPVAEDIEKQTGEGKGKAVMLCLGWQSKSAHMRFRESPTFRNNIHLLRDGAATGEMHHTSFVAY